MSFSGAIFALMRGHKVKRRHWTGYWYKNDGGEVIIHMHTGENQSEGYKGYDLYAV